MKKQIVTICLLTASLTGFSQNKKEQIEILSLKNDSLQKQINIISTHNSELVGDISNLNKVKKQITTQYDSLQIQYKKEHDSKVEIETDLKSVKTKLTLAENKINTLNDTLLKKEDKIKKLQLEKDKLLSLYDSLDKKLNPTPTFKIEDGVYLTTTTPKIEFELKNESEKTISFKYKANCLSDVEEEFVSNGYGILKFNSDCNCFASPKFKDSESFFFKLSLFKNATKGEIFVVFYPAEKIEGMTCWETQEKYMVVKK